SAAYGGRAAGQAKGLLRTRVLEDAAGDPAPLIPDAEPVENAEAPAEAIVGTHQLAALDRDALVPRPQPRRQEMPECIGVEYPVGRGKDGVGAGRAGAEGRHPDSASPLQTPSATTRPSVAHRHHAAAASTTRGPTRSSPTSGRHPTASQPRPSGPVPWTTATV